MAYYAALSCSLPCKCQKFPPREVCRIQRTSGGGSQVAVRRAFVHMTPRDSVFLTIGVQFFPTKVMPMMSAGPNCGNRVFWGIREPDVRSSHW
jgi:hypothetical protein